MCESRTVTTALAGQAEGASGGERQRGREGRAEVVVAAVRDEREEEGGMREDAVRARGGKDRGNHEWRSAAWLPRIPQRRASSILCAAEVEEEEEEEQVG